MQLVAPAECAGQAMLLDAGTDYRRVRPKPAAGEGKQAMKSRCRTRAYMREARHEGERGFALVIAVLIAGLLGLFASWIMTSVAETRTAARRAHYDTQARFLAQGAIERAIYEVSNGNVGFRGERAVQLAGGELSVTVTPVDGEPNVRRVVAQGAFPSDGAVRRRCAFTVLVRQQQSRWSIVRWLDERRP